jgi:hypothetical protein
MMTVSMLLNMVVVVRDGGPCERRIASPKRLVDGFNKSCWLVEDFKESP